MRQRSTRSQGPFKAALSRVYGAQPAEDVVDWLAQDLRRRCRQAGPPYEVRAYAQALGVAIERSAITGSGALEGWEQGRSKIMLPEASRSYEPCRRRENFTIAHELGHHLIRRHLAGYVPSTLLRRGHPEEEYLCNRFAAELLLPKNFVAAMVRKHGLTPSLVLWLRDRSDLSLQVVVRKLNDIFMRVFMAALWEKRDRALTAKWVIPAVRGVFELPRTGNSTAERALTSTGEHAGWDTFLLDARRSRWKCRSLRLGSSTTVLTIGVRQGSGVTLGAIAPLPDENGTREAKQLDLF